jgi:spore maturation protein CgeB
MKILYLGMTWNYGRPDEGLSFEHCNFWPALQSMKDLEVIHYDFVQRGLELGIRDMSHELLNIAYVEEPDIMFMVPFDPEHDPLRSCVERITVCSKTRTVAWFCDSHYRYDSFDSRWAPCLNLCLTTSREALAWYERDGFEVHKTQWGMAPNYESTGEPKDIDVSFVGLPHGNRRQVVQALHMAGINIRAYGGGWPLGRLNFPEMLSVWSRSKIVLNLSNAAGMGKKQVKGRNFEVPAVGSFLLTERMDELDEYYVDGKEIGTYSTVSEMLEKIKHYLSNPDEREAVARAGHERTIKDHLLADRLRKAFEHAQAIG